MGNSIKHKLSELHTGDEAIIVKVDGKGPFRKRITEMGFVKGQKVTVIKNAPLQDPVEYEIMGYNVSLRRSEAALISTLPVENYHELLSEFKGVKEAPAKEQLANGEGKRIRVALVGNPNCGKTTLFNFASGRREHVGNYSGVTVDAKEAKFKQGDYTFLISDLPGTYSITEYTPEELYVRSHILNEKPDVVINVIDASNLERNLYLTTQLIDMDIKVVVALNMYDELKKRGSKFNFEHLGKMVGIPFVPTVAAKGKGLKELFERVIAVYEGTDSVVRHVHINYGNDIEKAIDSIEQTLVSEPQLEKQLSPRYLAIKLLENDNPTKEWIQAHARQPQPILERAQGLSKKLETAFGEPSETLITDAKYGFVAGALKETFVSGTASRKHRSKKIDQLLTHKYLGFPFFLLFMWITFQATFTIGGIPMEWIDQGVGWLGETVSNLMPDGALRDLLVDGIIGGVGGVIVFLPNIVILFFFISLMEDTGYMARASFIMDKLMHLMGLHGKSFIPMVMGFGCNVPAIMATRTLENRSDRILTMLIIPFMSCSARLPVYVLLISAFFTAYQGVVLFSIYIIGIVLAVLMALLFKKTFFKKKEVPFVMELPPYRMPTLRNTGVHMWGKSVQYLQKMGGVILVASILIWALGYYPKHVEYSQDYDAQISVVESNQQLTDVEKTEAVNQLLLAKGSEKQANSYIGRLGHFIEPAIAPLGFDWKIGVSILTGLAAKEIVVSTMGVLYQANIETDDSGNTLSQRLQEQTFTTGDKAGEKVFSPFVAYVLMLFVLIYFPCVAVIAAIRKESNWKWGVFTMFYTTALAYVLSLLVYQIGIRM
jgi:ferrous iron transport protein B